MKNTGFSLIELLIALVVIGILVGIAYPIYTNQITETRRTEGKVALLNLQSQMQRYFTQNNTYATATIASGNATTDVLDNDTTENGWYQISISAQDTASFTISATPLNTQATDDAGCGILSINQLGVKTVGGTSSSEDCWG